MPTLFRFLRFIAIVALVFAAIVVALATLVRPHTREMREPLPRSFINRALPHGGAGEGMAEDGAAP